MRWRSERHGKSPRCFFQMEPVGRASVATLGQDPPSHSRVQAGGSPARSQRENGSKPDSSSTNRSRVRLRPDENDADHPLGPMAIAVPGDAHLDVLIVATRPSADNDGVIVRAAAVIREVGDVGRVIFAGPDQTWGTDGICDV